MLRALLLVSCLDAARGLLPNASFAAGVPLFAHVRWANFSAADLAGLGRFRSVTVQVEPSSPLPGSPEVATSSNRHPRRGARRGAAAVVR